MSESDGGTDGQDGGQERQRPEQPDDLPKNVAEPLESQSAEDLMAVAEWAEDLAEWRRSKPSPPATDSTWVVDRINYDESSPPSRSPERMESIVQYARALAKWRLDERAGDEEPAEKHMLTEDEEAALEERDSVDLEDFDVPTGAYKTKKKIDGRWYVYWQWREGPDSWGYEYIAPLDPK